MTADAHPPAPSFDHLTFIKPQELKDLIDEQGAKVQVIDVRGSDFEGGKIPGAINVPSEQWKDDGRVDQVVSDVKDKGTVVVHCGLSKQRGPTAASRLLERLQVVQGDGGPKVVVLEGGFTAWKETFGQEEGLIAPNDELPTK